MIEITDKNQKPNIDEIITFVDNPLFYEFIDYFKIEYQVKIEIMYSGDNQLLGWNIRLFKSGKTLCRLYPRKNKFYILLVIGAKEKERAELVLPKLCNEIQTKYRNTTEGMGQRWLTFLLQEKGSLYSGLLELIKLRAQNR